MAVTRWAGVQPTVRSGWHEATLAHRLGTVTTRRVAAVVAMVATGWTLGSCSSGEDAADETTTITSSTTVGRTHGPNGEPATPASALSLTAHDVAKVRRGHHTAALVWHEEADFTEAVTAGVRGEFRRLGIRVVAETSAGFDPAKQRADVETVAAKRPDVMLTLPVDPVITASAYRQVSRQGTKVVLLSNLPRGLRYGRDYVNVVTDDLFDMGKRAADALAAAVGGSGEIGYFFLDANSFVANQRDRAFLATLAANHPGVEVAARQGIADPNTAQEQANGTLVAHRDLDGVYVPFSQPVGDGVLAALRANGNRTTRIVSLDLDEPLALDMAKGGQTFAIIADRAHELGRAMAKSAAYALLGRRAPPFVVVPALTVTRSNLVEGYRASLNRDPPASVMKALGE
jgi:ribose transport system substrate-binding protein